jgi:hypothetical protein
VESEEIIKEWIRSDHVRMRALHLASNLKLRDWCIAAGFVRNLVWDKLHQKKASTPLNDFDLIYYDPNNIESAKDKQLELRLKNLTNQPWSVKNQARMHIRNKDTPYTSTHDAMSYWVEIETAVGVKLSEAGEIDIVAPFGLANLFGNTITINRKRRKPEDFYKRIESKNWLSQWPNLKVTA